MCTLRHPQPNLGWRYSLQEQYKREVLDVISAFPAAWFMQQALTCGEAP